MDLLGIEWSAADLVRMFGRSHFADCLLKLPRTFLLMPGNFVSTALVRCLIIAGEPILIKKLEVFHTYFFGSGILFQNIEIFSERGTQKRDDREKIS